jgi:hypothetical protein
MILADYFAILLFVAGQVSEYMRMVVRQLQSMRWSKCNSCDPLHMIYETRSDKSINMRMVVRRLQSMRLEQVQFLRSAQVISVSC